MKYKYKSTIEKINNRDSVWYKTYNQTIKENVNLFQQIIVNIQSNYPCAKITILVMPFNPHFRYTHLKCIRETKKKFDEIMTKHNLTAVDQFNHYSNLLLFDDHCHLSNKGAKSYTNYLINKLFKNGIEYFF